VKVHEYIAKDIFKDEGITVPHSKMVLSPDEAMKAAMEIGKPVAIKSQILSGGRGKAGGIKFAENPDEVYNVAGKILGSTLKDERVEMVLIEEKLEKNHLLWQVFLVGLILKKWLVKLPRK
jgi:succinyl-CoA synthetase beta subunit